jgi:hypothetical protein
MSRVREIEAFIAEREIGDPVITHRERYAMPILKRGILDLDPGDLTMGVGKNNVRDFATVPLRQRDCECILSEVFWWIPRL